MLLHALLHDMRACEYDVCFWGLRLMTQSARTGAPTGSSFYLSPGRLRRHFGAGEAANA